MRVSSQLSSYSGALKQMPSASRASSPLKTTPVKAEVNGSSPKAAKAPQSPSGFEPSVTPPLVSNSFGSPANLVLESMHALVKAESQKGSANTQVNQPESVSSFSGGPQALDIQELPSNELNAPAPVDLSALSTTNSQPGSEFDNEWTQGLKQDASPTALAKLSDSRFNVDPVQNAEASTGGPQALSLSPPESSELFVSNEIELNLATTELTPLNSRDTVGDDFVNGPSIDPEQGMRPEIKNLYAVMKRISEGTSYEFTNYEADNAAIQPERNYTNDLDVIGVGREPTAIFLSQAS